MSCSNDSGCSLYLVDSHGRKEGAAMTVRKGISSFDYSRELNVIGERNKLSLVNSNLRRPA